jgi:hypothetical protein
VTKKLGRLRRFIGLDWESLAGVIAAVTALVLHLLHLAPPDVLVVIAVLLLALLFIRDIRRERQDERTIEILQHSAAIMDRLQSSLQPADADLIGPEQIRASSEEFSREAQGEMIWFNVCLLMFKPEWLFNLLLRPAIENPAVTSVLFILDPKQRPLWEEHVVPKIKALAQNSKVQEPHWVVIDEMVSIIQGRTRTSEKLECLLSFWGEPFMSHSVDRDVPRYVFWARGHSELVTHLSELIRRYRLRPSNDRHA